MMHWRSGSLILLLAAVPPAVAQNWEVGGAVGGSFYTSQTAQSAAGSASATLAPGVTGSAWLGNNSGDHLGGEFRYDYSTGSLKLSGSGGSAEFAARTQSFHYDILYHFAPRSARVRPFVVGGGGVKIYTGTGQQQAYQPLQQIALLSKTNQATGLVSVGAGIKFDLSERLQFRIEVHDYLSPFPTSVIAPAPGAKISGWLQQFVPGFGLAYTF